MTYIIIALIMLAVLELVIIFLLAKWEYKIDKAADQMREYTELISSLYKISQKYEDDISERMSMFADKSDHQTEMYEEFCDAAKQIIEQNKRIITVHEDIVEKYNDIAKSHNMLLNAQKEWYKGIDDRYSQGYEQFKLCTDKLKELSYQVTDLASISTEDEHYLTTTEACDTVCIECSYDQCLKEDCPVYQIKQRYGTAKEGDDTYDP